MKDIDVLKELRRILMDLIDLELSNNNKKDQKSFFQSLGYLQWTGGR